MVSPLLFERAQSRETMGDAEIGVVEARMKPHCSLRAPVLRPMLMGFLAGDEDQSFTVGTIDGWQQITVLQKSLISIKVTDICSFPHHPMLPGTH